jgi:uncharacterized protein (DUF2147 family)
MNKLTVLAALLMATTAAHAGNSVSFEIEGHKVRIEVPRNCDSLSCLQISAPSLSGSGFGSKSRRFDDNDDVAANQDQPAPKSATAPAAQAAAPQAQAVAPAIATPAAPVASAPTAAVAPAPVGNDAPAPAVVATTSPAPVKNEPAASAAPVASTAASTTPVGIWNTEENKGRVRVEPCGANLCGYADNTGEKILINMKPSDTKWTGRIHDPDSGRNYDSTITMKGPNALRVQGCAFGGLFCGGQTWTRAS